ncbi:MAG TPA: helix-hairpin-helix domain-containing protein [Chromatiales bacterium]|nr:helix-hairpin-helix domain-containing protein [Chromatiales bacterium]
MNGFKGLGKDLVSHRCGQGNARRFPFHILFGLLLLVLSSSILAESVNINKADEATLQMLHGVGPVKASAIVKYRKTHGAFKSIGELKQVPGIGDGILEKNRGRLSLDKGLIRPPRQEKKSALRSDRKDVRRLKSGKKNTTRGMEKKTQNKKTKGNPNKKESGSKKARVKKKKSKPSTSSQSSKSRNDKKKSLKQEKESKEKS